MVIGIGGAALACLLASTRARARLAAALEQAWRSLMAARDSFAGQAGVVPETHVSDAQATTESPPETTAPPTPSPGDEREVPTFDLGGARIVLPPPEATGRQPVVDDGAAVEVPATAPVGKPDPRRTRRRWSRAAAAGAVVFAAGAVVAAAWAVWGDSDGSTVSGRVASAGQSSVLASVSQPSAKRIPVAGSAGKLVLVVAPDGRAALVVSGVQRAPSGRQFEIWVIVGATPTRAGLFSGGAGYVVVPLTQSVPKGATVAVTLERTGGVDAPTGKPLFAAKRA
jgi:hypothetical protein